MNWHLQRLQQAGYIRPDVKTALNRYVESQSGANIVPIDLQKLKERACATNKMPQASLIRWCVDVGR
jgi:hypothetical protein